VTPSIHNDAMAGADNEVEIASRAGRWIRDKLGRSWSVDETLRLVSRRTGRVYFVAATSPQSKRHRFVLKLYPADEAEAVQAEICSIRTAERVGVPVPEVIAKGSGRILMTRLPGRPVVRPRAGWAWLVRRLAELLVTIHSADVTSTTLGVYRPYEVDEPHAPQGRDWTAAEWERCLREFRSRRRTVRSGFCIAITTRATCSGPPAD